MAVPRPSRLTVICLAQASRVWCLVQSVNRQAPPGRRRRPPAAGGAAAAAPGPGSLTSSVTSDEDDSRQAPRRLELFYLKMNT